MVSVDKEKCIGCGSCEAVCGEVFELKDGKAHVKKGKEKSKAPCVKEAAEICAVQAIKAWLFFLFNFFNFLSFIEFFIIKNSCFC